MKKLHKFKILLAYIFMMPLIIGCSTEGSSDFDSSLIPVQVGERWGYINLKGEYVINPQFDMVAPFIGGYAWVMKGDKYGYINKKGEYAINPQYESVTSFSEGVAWVTRKG
ncbi:MAG: WG repeat-containing protein, partial [Muribaculaceae bacterium]|nr:WG repeat-containing protein [Muribaculaceae bacterium]